MKKTALVLLILLINITLIAHAHAYTNDKYAFTITPPDGWTTEEPDYAAAVFNGPTHEGYTINIKIQAEITGLSLEEYINTILQDMQTGLENFQLLAQANTTINTINATTLEYNFTYAGKTLQQKQATLINNTMAYMIIYTAPQIAYPAYLQEYENSLQTLDVYYTAPETSSGIEWTTVAVVATILVIIAAISVTFMLRRRKQQRIPIQVPQKPKNSKSSTRSHFSKYLYELFA